MQVEKLAEGLWRWTAWHPEWQREVSCVYAETAAGIVLVDPLVPEVPEDRERFWRALDGDVARADGRLAILVTVFFHTRSAGTVAKRYKAPVWAPSRARAAVARRAARDVRGFRPGDRLPGGVQALATARSNEVVLWLPGHRALVAGDVILGEGDGLVLCPGSWLPAGTTVEALRASLLPVLDLPVERVLLSHGEPVRRNGLSALQTLLA